MREKKWIDCPSCGAKKSMRARKNLHERLNPAGYPPLDIKGLEGQFCASCGEGFWSLKSERRMNQLLAEHLAQYDATRVVASELASIQEAAKTMRISVQGVHKMMKEGRLRFVIAAGRRLPIRKDLKKRARASTSVVPRG